MSKQRIKYQLFILIFYFIHLSCNAKEITHETNLSKILICGVCQNTELATSSTIANIEELGQHFSDYQVIIYENNSTDQTASIFSKWAQNNSHVMFLSENLDDFQLPLYRTERIARALNIVLEAAKNPLFSDYKYLIMADLDFESVWPIQEIIKTIASPIEWDCVSANGITKQSLYYDGYAFRDDHFPLGPEILGKWWWEELSHTGFTIKNEQWIPVYSAFGGLAIYKTETLLKNSYSGTVTDDLEKFYQQVLSHSSYSVPHYLYYLSMLGIDTLTNLSSIPIFFQEEKNYIDSNQKLSTCCEHVPLHASMALKGYRKFYINPKLYMFY